MRTITPTQTLPEIIAITGMQDFGPSDGEGSTCCPHCGALGRYVWYFICADGSRRGAMRGCIQLFPVASHTRRYVKLIREAYERQATAKLDRKKLASWWQEMVDAAEAFADSLPKGADHDTIVAAQQVMFARVGSAEARRQEWLSRNGYKRRRW